MKGIKYQINGHQYFIRFRYFNNKIVKCFLSDEDFKTVFVGRAKVNFIDGDSYNQEEGENLSLDRAIEKRKAFIKNMKEMVIKELDQQNEESLKIVDKIKREQIRFKKKQEKRILWEKQQAELDQIINDTMQEINDLTNELNENETSN
jgi:ubiquitin C-terminal hydrolase